ALRRPALLEELLNGRAVPIVGFAGSTIVNGRFAPDPTTGKIVNLADPFGGAPSPFGIGVTVIDNKAATPYVQQLTLGVQRQFGENNYLLSVDGVHFRGITQLAPRIFA